MRLDKLGMEKIRHLEHTYGQLSNTPHDHPYIEKLSAYGKHKPKKLDTVARFYISNEDFDKINRITEEKGATRTPIFRSWIVSFLKEPYTIDLTMELPQTGKKSINIYEEDYINLKKHSDRLGVDVVDLLTAIIKIKINELK